MTLEVPMEEFVATVRRMGGDLSAFVTHENGGTRLSAADPAKNLRMVAYSPLAPEVVARTLEGEGIRAVAGRWIPDDAPAAAGEIHVAAVAYRTDGAQPGLWVDAFPESPTGIQAIRAMFAEFQSTGEVATIPFEEFMRIAEPTAVVLSPAELRGFAAAKGDGSVGG